jgi:hypothetical protein
MIRSPDRPDTPSDFGQGACLCGAGASIDAGIPASVEIKRIMTDYAYYSPARDGIAIENLVGYIQLRIADSLGLRAADVNFECILVPSR